MVTAGIGLIIVGGFLIVLAIGLGILNMWWAIDEGGGEWTVKRNLLGILGMVLGALSASVGVALMVVHVLQKAGLL